MPARSAPTATCSAAAPAGRRRARRASRGVGLRSFSAFPPFYAAPLRALALAAFLGLGSLAQGTPAVAAELLYYHGIGCAYCEEWDAEVAPIYHKTDEGARLPLRRVSSSEPMPKDLAHIKGLVFTPTFVVLDDDGKEVGRIPGYQPDWFWAFLRKYIDKMDAAAKG